MNSLPRIFNCTNKIKRLIAIACVLTLSGCSQISTKLNSCKNDTFVTVEQTRFQRDSKPYFIVGANMWYGAYLGAPGQSEQRERLTRELDLLARHGINNLRILGAGEQSNLSRAVDTTIIQSPSRYNETLLQGLDFLLAEMAKRKMTGVIYLNNFWQWSGGMAQYMAWVENNPVFDPDATGRWDDFMQNSARFYSSEPAQVIYQRYMTHLITRKNTITGKNYACDSTIMAWQLANEPRPGSDKNGLINVPAYNNWLKNSAQLIHRLAPHHLVSSGSEGTMGSLRDGTIYKNAHGIPEFDYLTFHMWAKNWLWFNPAQPNTLAPAQEKARAYIQQHIQFAEELKKPIVLEEFGLDRDLGAYSAKTSTQQRNRYYQGVFEQLTQQARLGKPIAGFNFWAWGGFGHSQRADFIWRKGDDFTGDPPQEPQGLNSVFASDQSTLDIIKKAGLDFYRAP